MIEEFELLHCRKVLSCVVDGAASTAKLLSGRRAGDDQQPEPQGETVAQAPRLFPHSTDTKVSPTMIGPSTVKRTLAMAYGHAQNRGLTLGHLARAGHRGIDRHCAGQSAADDHRVHAQNAMRKQSADNHGCQRHHDAYTAGRRANREAVDSNAPEQCPNGYRQEDKNLGRTRDNVVDPGHERCFHVLAYLPVTSLTPRRRRGSHAQSLEHRGRYPRILRRED